MACFIDVVECSAVLSRPLSQLLSNNITEEISLRIAEVIKMLLFSITLNFLLSLTAALEEDRSVMIIIGLSKFKTFLRSG